jgi:hypothetical protein
MFEGHQANISQRSWRNSTSTLSYVRSRFNAMEVVLLGVRGVNPNILRVLRCVESLV